MSIETTRAMLGVVAVYLEALDRELAATPDNARARCLRKEVADVAKRVKELKQYALTVKVDKRKRPGARKGESKRPAQPRNNRGEFTK